jgi:hypothetical protein
MLTKLAAEPARSAMAPLPGWWARRRNDRPPADRIVAELPTGPALGDRPPPAASAARPSPPAASPPREPQETREEPPAPSTDAAVGPGSELVPRRDSPSDSRRPAPARPQAFSGGPPRDRHPSRGPHRQMRRHGGRPRRPGGR